MKVTHDPSERLSYNLFAEVSDKRSADTDRWPRPKCRDLCLNCPHAARESSIGLSREAEAVVASTNQKVQVARSIIDGLRQEGVPDRQKPFQQPIDFHYFDLWHLLRPHIKTDGGVHGRRRFRAMHAQLSRFSQ